MCLCGNWPIFIYLEDRFILYLNNVKIMITGLSLLYTFLVLHLRLRDRNIHVAEALLCLPCSSKKEFCLVFVTCSVWCRKRSLHRMEPEFYVTAYRSSTCWSQKISTLCTLRRLYALGSFYHIKQKLNEKHVVMLNPVRHNLNSVGNISYPCSTFI